MFVLLFLLAYAGAGIVTFPIATRLIYRREYDKYDNPLLAYRDALVVGGSCAVFWPIAVAVYMLTQTAMTAARMAAPPEVKKLITQHNTLMLERGLGMRKDEKVLGVGEVMDDPDYR